MSPETLLDHAPTTTFNQSEFDQYVMKTYGRFPVAIARGEGCRLWDTEGKSYLDFVAGIATCTLGHSHPKLTAAVSEQIQKLHHISNLYYIPEQGELAKWIVEHSCADKVFFCNSGAEANEAAIKLVRKYAHTVSEFLEQPVILTAKSSFHGRTLATITATGQAKYQKHFDPLPDGFAYVPYNDIQALKEAIADIDEGNRRVAAVMLEALQGEGGVRPGDVEYFKAVRKICDENNILLVLDEVQVGVGRTGKYWGYENLGIEPDIFTSAKGLAGGVPIGAMMCKDSCAVLQPGEHASTFGGNPFSCAAGLAIVETLDSDNLLENANARGQQLRTALQGLAEKYPYFVEARGWGLINGMEIKADLDLTSIQLVKTAMENGLMLAPAGPKVLRFVPPLIVTAEEIDEAIAILDKTLAELSI